MQKMKFFLQNMNVSLDKKKPENLMLSGFLIENIYGRSAALVLLPFVLIHHIVCCF